MAELVQLVGNEELAFLAALGPDAVIIRSSYDEDMIKQIGAPAISFVKSLLDKCARCRCLGKVVLVP